MTALTPAELDGVQARVGTAAVWLHDLDCYDGNTTACHRWSPGPSSSYDPEPHRQYYRERAEGVLDAAGIPALLADLRATRTQRDQYQTVVNAARTVDNHLAAGSYQVSGATALTNPGPERAMQALASAVDALGDKGGVADA